MLSAFGKKSCCICSFDWIDQSGQFLGSTIHDSKPQLLSKLLLRFPYYGFCFGFTKDFKNRILPLPTVPQHDIFIGLIAALKNEIVVLPEALCAHRKFINTSKGNISDSSINENIIINFFYRIKLILIVSIRSLQ